MRQLIIAAAAALAAGSPAYAQDTSYQEVLRIQAEAHRTHERNTRDYIASVSDWERIANRTLSDDELRPHCDIVALHRKQRQVEYYISPISVVLTANPYASAAVLDAVSGSVKERAAARRCAKIK